MNPASDVFASLEVAAVGHVTHDHYGDTIVAGGCAFYGARVFHGLGAKTKLLTAVGEDFACEDALHGLAVERKVGGQTTSFSNHYPTGQSRVQIIDCSAGPLEPTNFPPAWNGLDLLFIAPVMGELMTPGWVQTSGARFVSAGIQGFVKEAGDAYQHGRLVRARKEPLDLALMQGVDAAFLSEEDIELVGDDPFLDRLKNVVPIVALTRGERGCTIYTNGDTLEVGTFDVHCVDPTGAGDTFAAGMSLGLAAGWSIRDAARMGAAAASVVVEGQGGARLGDVHLAYERFPEIL